MLFFSHLARNVFSKTRVTAEPTNTVSKVFAKPFHVSKLRLVKKQKIVSFLKIRAVLGTLSPTIAVVMLIQEDYSIQKNKTIAQKFLDYVCQYNLS